MSSFSGGGFSFGSHSHSSGHHHHHHRSHGGYRRASHRRSFGCAVFLGLFVSTAALIGGAVMWLA
ncbi:hypothetical protein [Deinococcus yavapaiensis]|uniref:Uncharacterized protein n=1 Tax=Deinococcus yavapaiensis KR-236 TaxID=694435 RepID=A0A318SKF0_9DEIO|nr:hypothetical protein [Deinococcus yavapaiensis]PYE53055.1 hypothetical protein DES52_11038 [Deinococcus yavapaiensis KR-236]